MPVRSVAYYAFKSIKLHQTVLRFVSSMKYWPKTSWHQELPFKSNLLYAMGGIIKEYGTEHLPCKTLFINMIFIHFLTSYTKDTQQDNHLIRTG
jgi:hypothetical protein